MAETRNAMFFLVRRRSLSPPACGCAEAPWEGYTTDSMGVFGSAEGEGLLYWHHLGFSLHEKAEAWRVCGKYGVNSTALFLSFFSSEQFLPRFFSKVFGELLVDSQQLLMVTIGAALVEIGYEIQVFSLKDGPARFAWINLRVPVTVIQKCDKSYNAMDWLNFNGIIVSSLEAKHAFSCFLQEPFKSLPLLWVVHENALAYRSRQYVANGQTELLNDWSRVFNRSTVVVFPNYVLPKMGMNGSSCWHKYRQTTFINIFILFAASSTSLFMAQGRAMSNVIEVSQVAAQALPAPEVISDILNGNWDHERTEFSLPPLMTLLLGEPGTGGSSTPSMVGAVKKWQKSDPHKSLDTWRRLSEANSQLEIQLNFLSKLAKEQWDAYKSVIDSCSKLRSEKQASKPNKEAVIKALLGAKEAMLGIRYHMRLMGEAAGVPIEPESQTKFLDATPNLEGVLLAGVPGAGGFDAVFAVTLGDSSSNVTKTWSSLNVLALLVKEDPCGVSLESADPRTNEITLAVS
ncbi:uncharacterized protein DS421_20g698440 [Arachis hypogaea]|nr:uncharacterized protein DS421_20g698440 [Arachis hypogaea]